MNHQLQARTEPGRKLIALAEEHAADFATRAAEHDREASFPYENLEALKRSRFLYAPVPEEHGGLGVESVHDVLVASSRIAQGDASVTLGVNMHLVTLLGIVRMRRIALNREDGKRAAALGGMLEQFVRSNAAIAASVSEPEQDLLRQKTTASRNEDGWVVDGRKIITSMAPAATHFAASVTYVDNRGEERYAFAFIPRDTPGVTVHDDWDALGMRASGSTTVTFEHARIPVAPGRGAPAGVISAEWLEQLLASGPAHAASSLGVAEAAQQAAVGAVAARREKSGDDSVRSTLQHLAAENSIDLAAARGIYGRALELIDQYGREHPTGLGSIEEANAIFAEAQRAKAFVNQAAVRIVDRAMTIAGGGGYMNRNPLSRLYRDARAGAFMHPLAANTAFEYIGAVTLGINPRTF